MGSPAMQTSPRSKKVTPEPPSQYRGLDVESCKPFTTLADQMACTWSANFFFGFMIRKSIAVLSVFYHLVNPISCRFRA